MLRRHGQAAAANAVYCQAKLIVQIQRAVTVARRVAPGHKDALRLDLSAYFVLQLVTDLFQKHRGQRVRCGGQGNVSQFHAAQKLVHLGPEGRCQQKDLVAALQMARQVAAAVFQRQGGTRQTAVTFAPVLLNAQDRVVVQVSALLGLTTGVTATLS